MAPPEVLWEERVVGGVLGCDSERLGMGVGLGLGGYGRESPIPVLRVGRERYGTFPPLGRGCARNRRWAPRV